MASQCVEFHNKSLLLDAATLRWCEMLAQVRSGIIIVLVVATPAAPAVVVVEEAEEEEEDSAVVGDNDETIQGMSFKIAV